MSYPLAVMIRNRLRPGPVQAATLTVLHSALFTVLFTVLLIALFAWPPAQAVAQQGGKEGGPPPAPVVVASVVAVSDAPSAEYTGLIQPETKALLSAEAAGRLETLHKKVGDRVDKGEVVAVLDNPTLADQLAVLEAVLEAREAELRLAEQQQERISQLYERKLTSAQQYEDGRLTLAVTRAKLAADRVQAARLREQVERMVIRSPIKGQVISSTLELGQWITPNQPIFEIFNFDTYEVLVGVPGRLMQTVPDSGDVQVTVTEIDANLTGHIMAAVRHVNGSSGNFQLRVRVVNRAGLSLSGLLAKVRLPLAAARRMLTVPRDAVVRRGERTHVVVVSEDNKAQIVPVQVHGNLRDSVIVSGAGLQDGTTVVVRGNERLFPGMAVRTAESQSDNASGKL